MATFLLGQTLVFWSGILAGPSFLFLMLTCSFNLNCVRGICRNEQRVKLHKLHKYAVLAAIMTIGLHMTLALLSSVFHIWL